MLHTNNTNSPIYSKDAIEFVTIAAELCAFLENTTSFDKRDFVARTLKFLPLLYLKAIMTEKPERSIDEDLEDFVTEDMYETVRQQAAALLMASDRYLEVFSPDIQLSDEPLATDISEDLADIYQDLKNCLLRYEIGVETIMNDALAACLQSFADYWGQRLVNCLRALHNVFYTDEDADSDNTQREDNSMRTNFLSHQQHDF